MKLLWQFCRDILDTVDSKVDPLLNQRLLNLLDKEAFPSDPRKGGVLNFVSGRFDGKQGDIQIRVGLNQSLTHPIGLIECELTSPGSDPEIFHSHSILAPLRKLAHCSGRVEL